MVQSPSHHTNFYNGYFQSEWAPLSIGPYAQATTVEDCLVFVAGQIALVPATMKLLQPFDSLDYEVLLKSELELALSNADAVLRCAGASLSSVVSCVIYVKTSSPRTPHSLLFHKVEAWYRAYVQAAVVAALQTVHDNDAFGQATEVCYSSVLSNTFV